MKNFKKTQIFFILSILLVFTACVRDVGLGNLTLKIDESELNKSSSKFPIKKDFVLANVEVKKPNISVKETRIYANMDMKLAAIFIPSTNGNIQISGIPYFKKENQSIYLSDVKMEDIDFGQFTQNKTIVKTLVSNMTPLIDHIFKTIPIYTIKKDSYKGSFVQDVKIENSELLVTFGL